jgi:hypothetical protein
MEKVINYIKNNYKSKCIDFFRYDENKSKEQLLNDMIKQLKLNIAIDIIDAGIYKNKISILFSYNDYTGIICSHSCNLGSNYLVVAF